MTSFRSTRRGGTPKARAAGATHEAASSRSPVDSVEMPKVDSFRDLTRRELLSRGGGLVSADLSTKDVGVVVAKFPQQPSGMTYEGVLVFVRKRTQYRVTVRFPETNITGLRDAVLFDTHMKNAPADGDPFEGWASDPYDPKRRDPLMRNKADDEQHDSKFPDHPLTLVRAELSRLQRSL